MPPDAVALKQSRHEDREHQGAVSAAGVVGHAWGPPRPQAPTLPVTMQKRAPRDPCHLTLFPLKESKESKRKAVKPEEGNGALT